MNVGSYKVISPRGVLEIVDKEKTKNNFPRHQHSTHEKGTAFSHPNNIEPINNMFLVDTEKHREVNEDLVFSMFQQLDLRRKILRYKNLLDCDGNSLS
jgi:hypothetical protein